MNTTSLVRTRVRHGARVLAIAYATLAVTNPLAAQSAATRKVAINFKPMVGAEAFACGKSYANIGTSHATITPSDFGIYVHDVTLLAAGGKEVPVTLDQDGTYQNGTVALLDFEDGTGPCSNGNSPTHLAIVGTAPAGQYTGVRFTIGVPFERNHNDITTEPSPLSLTRMAWAWNSGHKFARLDAKTSEGKSWVLHLGSSGCMPNTKATAAPQSCAQPNRVTVTLPQFNIDTDAIVADAAVLWSGNGGADNQVCMSSPKSPACGPMFAVLGLPFNDAPAKPQTFLRRVAGGSTATSSNK